MANAFVLMACGTRYILNGESPIDGYINPFFQTKGACGLQQNSRQTKATESSSINLHSSNMAIAKGHGRKRQRIVYGIVTICQFTYCIRIWLNIFPVIDWISSIIVYIYTCIYIWCSYIYTCIYTYVSYMYQYTNIQSFILHYILLFCNISMTGFFVDNHHLQHHRCKLHCI